MDPSQQIGPRQLGLLELAKKKSRLDLLIAQYQERRGKLYETRRRIVELEAFCEQLCEVLDSLAEAIGSEVELSDGPAIELQLRELFDAALERLIETGRRIGGESIDADSNGSAAAERRSEGHGGGDDGAAETQARTTRRKPAGKGNARRATSRRRTASRGG